MKHLKSTFCYFYKLFFVFKYHLIYTRLKPTGIFNYEQIMLKTLVKKSKLSEVEHNQHESVQTTNSVTVQRGPGPPHS